LAKYHRELLYQDDQAGSSAYQGEIEGRTKKSAKSDLGKRSSLQSDNESNKFEKSSLLIKSNVHM
jgi:hypothetical protein